MEFLKRNLTQVQNQLGSVSFATKWLLGALVVILLLAGTMLVLWGGSADLVPLDDVASGSQSEIYTALKADGIDARLRDGKVMVPVGQKEEAVGSLSRAGHLNPNAHIAFDKLMSDGSGSMLLSSTEKNRNYLMAKSQFLSAVIGSFPNVETASVILDKPDPSGFGPSHIDPSASVMVTMQPGGKVNRQMADTLIHMVSSAVAGLREEDVTVSDLMHSRSFTAADEDDAGSLASHEANLVSERLHKQKIEDVLRSWSGAMVAVKIVTSQVLREEVRSTEYDKPAISSTENNEIITEDIADAGEPGPRANLGTSIDGARTAGSKHSETHSIENFTAPLATRQSTQKIAGNAIRKINVSVVVPRSYYVRVFQAQNPEAEAPSDADLQPIIDAEEAKIASVVQPQIVSSDEAMAPGEISVAMVYDREYLEPATAGMGMAGGLGAVMGSDSVKTGILGGMAILTLGLMVYLTRRATRTEDLPSIEELAGVPPTLPTDDDLIGEVDEMDQGLAGVELDEDELRARQIADQISDLIRANPEEAGGLITKWVVDDQQ